MLLLPCDDKRIIRAGQGPRFTWYWEPEAPLCLPDGGREWSHSCLTSGTGTRWNSREGTVGSHDLLRVLSTVSHSSSEKTCPPQRNAPRVGRKSPIISGPGLPANTWPKNSWIRQSPGLAGPGLRRGQPGGEFRNRLQIGSLGQVFLSACQLLPPSTEQTQGSS